MNEYYEQKYRGPGLKRRGGNPTWNGKGAENVQDSPAAGGLDQCLSG